jgi:aldehyde:ferredoxin oxidoreductase
MKRRLLTITSKTRSWRLETLQVETARHDEREDYLTLHGEPLCQYILRRDDRALILARGPMAFMAGNKATVGYLSPLTDLPHYSFVGGRAAAQLVNLGLDAIVFSDAPGPGGASADPPIVVVSGRAPDIHVAFRSAADLPTGQRAAFYHLVAHELTGNAESGSIFTLGEGARHGYKIANLAADGIYHAGRGGAGHVFGRHAGALVLRGTPLDQARFFSAVGAGASFARSPNRALGQRLLPYTARLSGATGGTIPKLFATGCRRQEQRTLPARNATQMGYALAGLGDTRVLSATRDGHTGCHWCPVDCRHWHWVEADYAPDGRDRFLDDFEPTYALFAMLDLPPDDASFKAQLRLLEDVNRRLILPIEQMGCDVMDVGIGLAALLEGLARGFVPPGDVPPALAERVRAAGGLGDLEAAVIAVDLLRQGLGTTPGVGTTPGADEDYPALAALGDGPQALAARYPAMQDIVYTCGQGTLGNAGHSNALWTFLMPFSRFFSHYSGQIYKIDEDLPTSPDDEALRTAFERVVARMLDREYFGILCNALSNCAFTFVVFSQDGKGEQLDDADLLVRTLTEYGIHTTREDLMWFAQAFWAQSIDLKRQYGWRPPAAADLPQRVYEGLSLVMGRPVSELMRWMDMLIDVWRAQAAQVLARFGYQAGW